MVNTKKLGSVKRFGPRYGKKGKVKLAKIEAIQRGKHQCPYCHAWKVRRIASGIWECRKCDSKFTGKSYSIKKVIVTEDESVKKKKEVEEVIEEELEDEEDILETKKDVEKEPEDKEDVPETKKEVKEEA